jgi:hypothetical protein
MNDLLLARMIAGIWGGQGDRPLSGGLIRRNLAHPASGAALAAALVRASISADGRAQALISGAVLRHAGSPGLPSVTAPR